MQDETSGSSNGKGSARTSGKTKVKTRETTKDIKVLDRAGNLADRTRVTLIRSKQNAQSLMDESGADGTDYAVDRTSETARDVAREAPEKTKNAAKKAKNKAEEKIRKHIERRVDRQERSDSKIRTRDVNARKSSRVNAKNTSIKAREQAEKTIKTTARNAGKETVKTAQRTIKTTEKTIKTAEKTAKASIKTAQKTAKAAQKSAEATAKASEKAVVMVQKAAVAAEKAAIATARAVATAVKAAAAVVKQIVATAGSAMVAALPFIAIAAVLATVMVLFTGDSAKPNTSKFTNAQIISGINQEWQNQMDIITSGYENVEMDGSRAPWPYVFSVYNARAAGSKDGLKYDKNIEITQIFWEMHYVEYDIYAIIPAETVPQKDTHILMQTYRKRFGATAIGQVGGTAELIYQNKESPEQFEKVPEGKKLGSKIVVHVKKKTLEEMADYYEMDDWQREQIATMTTPEFDSFWMETIYGIIGGDGDIVNVALTQVGNTGGWPYWEYCGFPSRVEWCACFVSWCAGQCGYVDAGLIPNTGSPPYQVQFFRSKGQWLDGQATPAPGMIIFFDWYNADFADHVGIVEKVEGNTVYTVEGNSSDTVKQKQWTLGDSRILGYGYIEK